MLFGNQASEGKKPTTPTIGTASDGGTGTTVSVAFTPSTYIGKGTITYTATSSPGSITGTGSGSPITVSGLTAGTAYTFTVAGTTNYGVLSDSSAASNSVTPLVPSSFDSIATATGTGSSNIITFSSIPQTYKHLQIRFLSIDTNGTALVSMIPNSYVGTSGANHFLRGDGTNVLSTSSVNNNAYWLSYTPNSSITYPIVGIVDIMDYASTTKNKTVKTFSGLDINSSTGGWVQLSSAAIFTTPAITDLQFKINIGNFKTDTQVALYGIKG